MNPYASITKVLVASLLAVCVLSANPIKIPIIKNAMTVETKVVAKLPDEFPGSPAAIICIKPFKGSSDLAVCTLRRIFRVKQNGAVSLFLNVEAAFKAQGRKLNFDNKQHGGLRSVAFHPGFKKNGLFYVSAMEQRPSNPKAFKYISNVGNPIAADSVVVEFKVKKGKADPKSYRLLFRVGMPVFDHPIKQIEFHKNLLYIAHGDGSVQSATAGGGQNNNALGKILRINPIKKGSKPYTIPGGNPFIKKKGMPNEVFAIGFRNPHHLCFAKNGKLFVADTGRDNVEEVNIVLSGKNYGWSKREGTFVHKKGGGLINGIGPLPGNDAKFKFEYPVAQVGHVGNQGAGFVGQAIAGGCPIQNGSPMSGKYYYADFPKSGNLYFSNLNQLFGAKTRGAPGSLKQARTFQAKIKFNGKVFDNLGGVLRSEKKSSRVDVRFGRGSKGELYWSSKQNGKLYVFTSSKP